MMVPELRAGEVLDPIVSSVEVAAERSAAFALFTERIGDWWPMGTHSVFGAGATVAFEEGRLVERHGGRSTSWGEVLDWDPPRGFTITWHPGLGLDESTEVTVTFHEDHPGTTLVRLVHSGWEKRSAAARSSYTQGWPRVLHRLVEAARPDAAQSRFMNG